jgi:hypothetical protein
LKGAARLFAANRSACFNANRRHLLFQTRVNLGFRREPVIDLWLRLCWAAREYAALRISALRASPNPVHLDSEGAQIFAEDAE